VDHEKSDNWLKSRQLLSTVAELTTEVQSTDHELIAARNASLAAMHGSANESNVRYYPT
jgi:hypothetical protein